MPTYTVGEYLGNCWQILLRDIEILLRDKMTHPLQGLISEIKSQIKNQNFVHIFIDKETIDRMRKSMRTEMLKASVGVGGIDKRIKDFGVKNHTIREDAKWISQYIRRNINVNHKLKFIVGGTEIHIMTDADTDVDTYASSE